MAFKLFAKTAPETEVRRRTAATGPLPALSPLRHVPRPDEIRESWQAAHPDGPIPAVLNLFGDATGQLLRARLAEAVSLDDFLGIAQEARAYGDHDVARVAADRARSLAVGRRQLARIEGLEAALAPSELEKALGL